MMPAAMTETCERMNLGHFNPYQESLHLNRYEYACGFVGGRKVLDIACGTGYGCAMLAKSGAAFVTGLDLDAGAIQFARQTYSADNIRFDTGNAQHLADIEDASFDVVTSFETIEHLPDVEAYLAELCRVLKPGGLFLVSTPDRRLESTLYPLRGRPNNPFHLREYTRRQFVEVVSTRFEPEELLGQSFVSYMLAAWPVQVAIKASCFALRRFGAYQLIDRLYHPPTRTTVEPARKHRASIASYWLIRARRR